MREAGILAPISSLPSSYGIGDFGENTYRFIDYLVDAKVKIWQILPINPVGYGSSPYQPYSSFAGEELYIDLDYLYEIGLINKPDTIPSSNTVDYQAVRTFKTNYLKEAYQNFIKDNKSVLDNFIAQKPWVNNYAKFITFKKKYNLRSWLEWDDDYKYYFKNKPNIDHLEDQIYYEVFIQYIFFTQWSKLKEYANSKGIKIMGDIPIYVGIDSQDTWEDPEQFLLDSNGYPTFIAGVPPDNFAPTGQRWGNPLYNWDVMINDNFKFWVKKIKENLNLFDILRIDHFRAFDTYWKIDAKEPTAEFGEWIEAPGYQLFDRLYEVFPDVNIVVEDLGGLRDSVLALRDHYNLAGMKVLQLNFGPGGDQNNYTNKENMIHYTGTHDNETSVGWFESHNDHDKQEILNRLYEKGYYGPFIDMFTYHAFNDISNLTVIPVWDVLALNNDSRFNTPGTLGSPNWEWRFNDYEFLKERFEFIKSCIETTNRSN